MSWDAREWESGEGGLFRGKCLVNWVAAEERKLEDLGSIQLQDVVSWS